MYDRKILTDIHGNESTGHAGCHVAAPNKMALRPLRVYRKIEDGPSVRLRKYAQLATVGNSTMYNILYKRSMRR